MERKVLTEDEITKIKDLKKEFKDLTNAIGETEVQLMNLEFTKEQLKIGFQNIQQQEMVIAKELEEPFH